MCVTGKGPVAMMDRCPHRAAALSEGRLTSAGNLQCVYHGKTEDCARGRELDNRPASNALLDSD